MSNTPFVVFLKPDEDRPAGLAPKCTPKGTGEYDCSSANTEGEFIPTYLPLTFYLTPGNGAYPVPFYLKYYQQLYGVENAAGDLPLLNTLYVEPLGNNCNEVIHLGGLDNFWRQVINLNVGTAYLSVSQACPIRNCAFGDLFLCSSIKTAPTCGTSCDYTSGGFMSHTIVRNQMNFTSQQQYLAKDCDFQASPSGGAWNITFLNCTFPKGFKAPPIEEGKSRYTIVEDPAFQEYKYPLIDVKEPTAGAKLDSAAFSITRYPSASIYYVSEDEVENNLSVLIPKIKADYILLAPGFYIVDTPLKVTTSLVGLGSAILLLKAPITFTGCTVCSLIMDTYNNNHANLVTFEKDVLAFDLSIRHGGLYNKDVEMSFPALPKGTPASISVNCALTIGDNCYGENIWVWRADHGGDPTRTFTKKENSPADYGVIVNGNDVHLCGLQVEHFDKVNLTWNGDRGKLVMFQCEMPYYNDVAPYPAVVINGRGFEGYGMGMYTFLHNGYFIPHALEITPRASRGGIKLVNTFVVKLDGNGQFASIIADSDKQKFILADKQQGTPYFVDKYETQAVVDPIKPPVPPTPTKPKKPSVHIPVKKSSHLWIWVILAVIIILVGVLIYFLSVHKA